MKTWLEMLPTFEGRYNFLYPDGNSLPTCGEGHAVPTPEAAVAIFGDPRAAKDWETIRNAPRGHNAASYSSQTACRLTDAKIQKLKDTDVAETNRKLLSSASDSVGWPIPVQDACRDIVWNTGHLEFTEMIKAIRAGDWKTAAKESHRIDIQDSRNDWTRDSILAAIA